MSTILIIAVTLWNLKLDPNVSRGVGRFQLAKVRTEVEQAQRCLFSVDRPFAECYGREPGSSSSVERQKLGHCRELEIF